jgi:hypothetical protein
MKTSNDQVAGARTSRKYLFFLLLIGAVVAVACYPLKVTADGYHYMSSARALWTPEDSLFYYWIREPGYPFFLKALQYLFGSSDIPLSIFQSVMMSGAIAVLLGSVVQPKSRLAKMAVVSFGASTFFIGQFFGYSSFVLKQPMIVFFVALSAVLAGLSFVVKRSRSVILLLLAVLLGAVVAPQIAVSLKYFFLWPAFLVPMVLFIRRQRLMALRRKQYLIDSSKRIAIQKTVFPLAFSLMTVALMQLSENSWDNYKAENGPATARLDYGFDESDNISNLILNPTRLLEGVMTKIPILLMFTPTDNPGKEMENILYTKIQADPAWLCGAYDEYSDPPYTEFGSYMARSCRSREAQNLVRSILPTGTLLYRILMVMAMLTPLFALALKRWTHFAIFGTGLWFALTYGFANRFTVDRYGLPIFPFGVAATVFLVSEVISLISKKRNLTAVNLNS